MKKLSLFNVLFAEIS